VGKCCWIPELPWQTSFGGFVSVLRPNPKKVEPRFLYRWFASTRIQALLRSFGRQTTNISNLDVERSLQLELPLPSLHEQRRIVDILDKADGLRAKRRSALEKLSDLTQSIFLEMFGDPGKNLRGWKCAPLASVSTIFGEYGSGVPSIDFDPSLPRYVRITDINDEGRLVHSRVSPGGSSAQWDTLFLEDGDILFARSGATVGKTFKYKSSDGPCVFAGYLIRFRTDRSRLLPDTLFHFTRTSAYAQWVAARQRVVAQPNINAQQYGWELTVPLPPVRLQLEFSRLLQTVEATFNRESQAVSLHDGLFASLQHQAFSGAL
jgi:type I restriction enzyme S subunit